MDGVLRQAVDMVLNDSDEDDLDPPPRRLRFIRERENYFEDLDDVDFVTRFRLSKEIAYYVLTKIDHHLEFQTDKNRSVSPINQLLLCLRFYATGCTQLASGDFSRVSASTANRIIHRVSRAIALMYREHTYFPRNEVETRQAKLDFYQICRFPKCIGAIDCTRVRISSPGGENAEYFRNIKGYFSLNVQAIVNPNLEFLDLVARWPGSAHDLTIFDQSAVRARFENGLYGDSILVADAGYANRRYMMLPLRNPVIREEILYNESQIRTRNPVERVFGVWKRRFPVLALGIRTKLARIMPIIVATAVLFNILRRRGEPEPPDDPNLPLPDGMPWDALIAYGQMPARRQQNDMIGIDPHRQALIHEYFRTLRDIHASNRNNQNPQDL